MRMTLPAAAAAAPSVTSFRSRVRRVLDEEAAGQARDIIILAIDGIPLALGNRLWPEAAITPMCSVVPTTSMSSWLSSLTGLSVERHGVPGVVIRVAGAGIVNVLEYKGPLPFTKAGNIFSDAEDRGYLPLAVMGDWEPYDCSWRDALLADARRVSGHLFYTGRDMSAESIAGSLRKAVEPLRSTAGGQPRLIWCFVDADQAVHRQGYSNEVCALIERVESIALQWTRAGAVVIAHSDHGLTATRHRPELQEIIDRVTTRFDCALGGAGRMRFVFGAEEKMADAMHAFRKELPPSVAVLPSDEIFEPGSLARERVGDIALIATDRDFITFGGQSFEHGSILEEELLVPMARW